MKFTTIEYEKRGHVAYVTLNRPDKLNAMNTTMHHELGEVWADYRDDPQLRAAILSGNGRCFSAGADLSGGAPTEKYRYTGDFPSISRTQKLYKPIVSALHSHVVGYGMWIGLDADIRIATPDTLFWLPEPQWGIATIPAGWFPKMMPWAIASELLLMAERVGAQRAYDVGMINKIVERDVLMQEAEAAAKRLCELSPVAVQGMKESMVRASNLDYSAVDQITDVVQTRVMNSEDRREGGRAFVEKRQAEWSAGNE
jgi:enoyl-CoA hydratase/carnithine racemase